MKSLLEALKKTSNKEISNETRKKALEGFWKGISEGVKVDRQINKDKIEDLKEKKAGLSKKYLVSRLDWMK